MRLLAVRTLLATAAAADVNAGSKPHIVFVMQDDLGWWDTGLHGDGTMLPVSQRITALSKSGILMTNHLVHFHCSPTRRSFISGRLPIHHGEDLSAVASDDVDLRWTLISGKLKSAGYQTHWVGKGHTGFLSVNHLPTARGFDSFLGFLGGSQSYTSEDRWMDANPLTNTSEYSTSLFGARALDLVATHNASVPFFLYLAWQAVHSPYDAVPQWNNSCTGFAPYPGVYAGMVYEADLYTGKLVDALKSRGMWENTLLVYSSDNGGVSEHGLAGINYPLRGEKHSNWRGGYRVAAFVAGGLVPARLHGTTSNLRIHVVDWYVTFCNLAGAVASDDSPVPPLPVDPSNPNKDIYGKDSYPGLDGVDVWPLLTANRTVLDFEAHPTLTVTAQVYLHYGVKLLLGQGNVGDSGEKTANKDGWRYPNGTWVTAADVGWKCGLAWKEGDPYIPCLFGESDLREEHDLAPNNGSIVKAMWEALNRSLLTSFKARSPNDLLGPCNPSCATQYWKTFGGRDGPTCGVSTCGPAPNPPPSPPTPTPPGPVPPSPPSPPTPGHGYV